MLGRETVRDLPEKLRVTAALLGCESQKALCAAFRRVNPATGFDLDRSYKWMQGRTQPRSARVYADWAVLLDAGRPGAWVAGSGLEEFLDAVCARHGANRDALLHAAGLDPQAVGRLPAAARLAGGYACYGPALPPAAPGCIGRASLWIEPARRGLAARLEHGAGGLRGPALPWGAGAQVVLRPIGPGEAAPRCLHLSTAAAGLLVGVECGFLDEAAGLLAGMPFGRRVALLRVPDAARLEAGNGTLDGPASADLAALGLHLDDPAALDRGLGALLRVEEMGGGWRSRWNRLGWDAMTDGERAGLTAAWELRR